MLIKRIEFFLVKLFSDYETERRKDDRPESVLPRWVLRKRIKIICNGNLVFDSFENDGHAIPMSIQYTIIRYGLPDYEYSKKNRNKPIIYNISTDMMAID